MNAEAAAIIARLGLVPLPDEGGFFRRSWLSPLTLADGRAAGAAIYFLITPGNFSALHRLRIDELWHFYAGDPVEHVQLGSHADATVIATLGPDVINGHVPQLLVPAGVWQGARIAGAGARGWSLLGTTTSPAWTEADFELGKRETLRGVFPAQAGLVAALTR